MRGEGTRETSTKTPPVSGTLQFYRDAVGVLGEALPDLASGDGARSGVGDSEPVEAAQRVVEAVDREGDVIHRIVDVSRLFGGLVEMHRRLCSVIEPRARKAEVGPVAFREAERFGVEGNAARQILRADVYVIDVNGHVDLRPESSHPLKLAWRMARGKRSKPVRHPGGSRTVAVARHAIPSLRPVKPSRSVVVALTATRPMSRPAISATRARIASRWGPIFGASQIKVASRWTRTPPRARTFSAAWARKTCDAAPFHCGSEGGKCAPISPSASAP